jgi:hypothetical protein
MSNRSLLSQAWWNTPEIPAFESVMQEDLSSRPAWATQGSSVSKKERKKKKKKKRIGHSCGERYSNIYVTIT